MCFMIGEGKEFPCSFPSKETCASRRDFYDYVPKMSVIVGVLCRANLCTQC